jgi:hypothetical protein
MKIIPKSVQDLLLFVGAKSGDNGKIKEALAKGASINARREGWTPWMHAYANGHHESVKLLEANKAEVTEADRLTAGMAAKMNKACDMLPSARDTSPAQKGPNDLVRS